MSRNHLPLIVARPPHTSQSNESLIRPETLIDDTASILSINQTPTSNLSHALAVS
ncbi:hypothetical protein BDN70DRAFT_889194 [Pholiota conissans]|uniref:Uncharacterized protein n=1 Tax=Pholiota conissans TaxID=109636 RepID=A0A9P5YJH7_9AGAR|nr:hypothetical protein BDN70DRAFT_889194 [Pholiota conissans]